MKGQKTSAVGSVRFLVSVSARAVPVVAKAVPVVAKAVPVAA
ncbi:MAG: hypothetical protein WB765_20470 [Acidimicrobiales bacterium]